MTYEYLAQLKQEVVECYVHLRKTNQSIPDTTIDFVHVSALINFRTMVIHARARNEITEGQADHLFLGTEGV